MKLDNWTMFNLSDDTRQLVNAFGAPEDETALLKSIPISNLDVIKPSLREISHLTGKTPVVRFRGPRYDAQKSNCLKKDAWGFSVYFR